ncbi:MAG: MYXO-CTERM sorting domain-containing protein [Nannocystaceae bacterium]
MNRSQTSPSSPSSYGCETEALAAGARAWLVGYGDSDAVPKYGVKRKVEVLVNGLVAEDKEASLGDVSGTACMGDSGGPAYIQLSDGTWRVFGITSWGSADCNAAAFYQLAHVGVPWMESELAADGIDLTPCFATDGSWAPTKACRAFPKDAQGPFGSWEDGCVGTPVSAYSETCGEPFLPPDSTPPAVVVTAPEDGTQFDTTDGSLEITVRVDVDDGPQGWGAKSAWLVVDGVEQLESLDEETPFEWTIELPPGVHDLGAKAVDEADNVGEAMPIKLGIDESPYPEPEPTDTGAGDDAGEDGGKDGCSCRTKPGPSAHLALLLLGLTALRRRR